MTFDIETIWKDRSQIEAIQSKRLREMLHAIVPRNRFWTSKLQATGVDASAIRGLEDLTKLPFVTKQELVDNQTAQPPYGSNLSRSEEHTSELQSL